MDAWMKHLVFACAIVCLAAKPKATLSQSMDIIRGRVVSIDNEPLSGVTVKATSARGDHSRMSRTESDGRFTITFPTGDGHYFLSFVAVGFAPRQIEVRRLADEEVLVANATLQFVAAVLDSVSIIGGRVRVPRGELQLDVGGTEQSAVISAASQQDIASVAGLAGSIPGATTAYGLDGDPSGFSVLGLPIDQNAITLNGVGFIGANLPRDASITATLATNPYDVAKGGFSGGQLNLQRTPGSNFSRRSTSLLAEPPFLQRSVTSGDAFAQKYSGLSFGGIVSGPIAFDKAYYNLSFEIGRRANRLTTLLHARHPDLVAAGIEPDSVDELFTVLRDKGIPLQPTADPGRDRTIRTMRIFGTFDFAPANVGSGQTVNLNVFGSTRMLDPVGQSLVELPAHNGERIDKDIGAQVTHSGYLKNLILSETTLDIAAKESAAEPYFRLPSANVLLTSRFADGTRATRALEFGGSASLGTKSNTSAFGARNQLSWFSSDNSHRVKLFTEFRETANIYDPARNVFGTFRYESLADIRADRPSSFSRTLFSHPNRISETTFAVALGDAYKKTSTLQIQYGVRLDANIPANTPAFNEDVYSAFGSRNDYAPHRLYLSPRVGFAWTYGATTVSGGSIRGGAGIFQNVSMSSLLSRAVDNTGLSDAEAHVYCVGGSVPHPDWSDFLANPSTIPERCASGTQSSPFTNTAPNVLIVGRRFSAPRSARANLQWNARVFSNQYSVIVDAIYSRNMNQSSLVDLNFDPRLRFALTNEAGRPVFAEATSIVQETGFLSPRATRVFPQFNQVLQYGSDLVSESRQIRLTMSPVRSSGAFRWLASYVYSSNREQFNGFTSSGTSPLEVGWSPSDFDSRHQFTANLEANFSRVVRIDAFVRLASGVGFTPLVGGDINGDGILNDRAFIFDPSVSPDTPTSRAMRELLDGSRSFVRSCLIKQLGVVASRNSCRAPWTSTANLVVTVNPKKIGLSQRVGLAFVVSNPITALDHALHGSQRLRGWGQPFMPDQTLLFVRGFDATTKQYRYDLNSRFGGTNPRFVAARQPLSVAASLRLDFGVSREQQAVIQQLEKGRRFEGPRLTQSVLRAMYGSGGVQNPIAQLLNDAERLELTREQADSLAVMNVNYSASQDSIWTYTTQYLADLPIRFNARLAYKEYKSAREATIDLLIRIVPSVDALLTVAQKKKLSPSTLMFLDRTYLMEVRDGSKGDSGAGIFSRGATGLGGSGSTVITRIDIINRYH